MTWLTLYLKTTKRHATWSLDYRSRVLMRVYTCSLLSLSLSLPLPFSALFLLSTYNGQTHNKEGKTRGCGTRYVGRLTMENTWVRVGAFVMLRGGRRYRAPIWNLEGREKKRKGTGKKREGLARRKAQEKRNNASSFSVPAPSSRFSPFSLLSSSFQQRLMLLPSPLLQSSLSTSLGANATLSDLFAKHRTQAVTWYARHCSTRVCVTCLTHVLVSSRKESISAECCFLAYA